MQQNDQMDPRTAAAVQKAVEQLNEQWQVRMRDAANDEARRKWCIEAASKLADGNVIMIAKQMHAFLLEALGK